MSFHVGQRVVCVDDDWGSRAHEVAPHLAKKGVVYHVRDIYTEANGWRWLRLVEIVNTPPHGYFEPQFAAHCFRPVVERKTDISVFTEMLTPSKTKVDA